MDVDMMKQRPPSSVSEDQMDMLSIMMQMEKLPDFNDPFEHSNVSTIPFPEIQFTSIAASSNLARPPTVHQNADEASLGSLIPVTSPIQLLANDPGHEQEKYSQISPFPNMGPYPDKKNNNSMAAMREMIFRIAVMQPIHIDPESIKPPKRRNVKISKDPQSVAARHRRERISERIRILQRLVPGGTKMDTASMLDEAIHYLKFLKKQVQSLEQAAVNRPVSAPVGFPGPVIGNMGTHSGSMRGCQLPMSSHYHHQAVGNLQMLR